MKIDSVKKEAWGIIMNEKLELSYKELPNYKKFLDKKNYVIKSTEEIFDRYFLKYQSGS